MSRIKKFFCVLWEYLTLPYCWLTTRKIDKKLTQIAEEDRKSFITDKDVEFFRDLGIEMDKRAKSDGKSKQEV